MHFCKLVVFIALADCAIGRDAQLDDHWADWKRVHSKAYNGVDENKRREIWEANVKTIQAHNIQHDLGTVTFTMGVNQFSDMDWEEFQQIYLPTTLEMPSGVGFQPPSKGLKDLPESFDWRWYGYIVTKVKDQGQCGSCWAFSTTGAVECQANKATGKTATFSEQQLVDCTRSYGNNGCNGGWMQTAYKYIKEHGLESEMEYPYYARDDQCKHDPSRSRVNVTRWVSVKQGDEADLTEIVARYGPTAVAVDVQSDFQHYKKGVYTSSACSSEKLSHAVLTVGYGKTEGREFWVVKNSWGTWWGDEGYILMARNHGNMCGIATAGSVPLVEQL